MEKVFNRDRKKYLLHFVAFFGVTSVFVIRVDNRKALELTNGIS